MNLQDEVGSAIKSASAWAYRSTSAAAPIVLLSVIAGGILGSLGSWTCTLGMRTVGGALLIGAALSLLGGLAILAYLAIRNPRALQSEKFQMDAMKLEHKHRKFGEPVLTAPGRRNLALSVSMEDEN